MPLSSDNQAAIGWATGERCPSGRAKHIDVRVHFIRELVNAAKLIVTYVASEKNDADILTKTAWTGIVCWYSNTAWLGTRSQGGVLMYGWYHLQRCWLT